MKAKYKWGTNSYYYLAGKLGIHPTYLQEMLSDSRYSDADILAVIDHLKSEGGKNFSFSNLDAGRVYFKGNAIGNWAPKNVIEGKEVLILATGPSVRTYKYAIEEYIRAKRPFVIALNNKQDIQDSLIDIRTACHPVRLLADCETYLKLPQPLVCPASMLPGDVKTGLSGKELLDFGINVEDGRFVFNPTFCTLPKGLVIAYTLAIAASGKAGEITIAGLDGYPADDPRNLEMDDLLSVFINTDEAPPLKAITPTRYRLPKASVYQLN